MKHYPKFSLILLIPCAIYSSQTPPAGSKGGTLTFFPGGKPAAAAATASTTTAASITTDDTSKALTTSILPTVAVSTSTILGSDYPVDLAPTQATPYQPGRDGIAKVLRLETSITYIARLLRDGKFADAAKYNDDSCLPDHIRRAISSKREELKIQTDTTHKTIRDLLTRQHQEYALLLSTVFPLVNAIITHTPNEVALGTVSTFKEEISNIVASKKSLLDDITKEFLAQENSLKHLLYQLELLKQAQSAPVAQPSGK